MATQKKVNAHWAAMERAAPRFDMIGDTSIGCPVCAPFDAFDEPLNGVEEPIKNSCRYCVYALKKTDHPELSGKERWKHARKGSRCDLAMGELIKHCPRLQAVIEAIHLTAATPDAKPMEARTCSRL